MIVARAIWLAAWMAVSLVGPGMLLVRRTRWGALEKLCAAVAASLVMIYLVVLGAYIFQLGPWIDWAAAIASAAATVACAADLRRLWAQPRTRHAIIALALLVLYLALLTALPRHFAGGLWSADWVAHYQKSLFLMHRTQLGPSEIIQIIGRPPLVNAMSAHFMALAGAGFEVFQLTFLYFAALTFLPCCLLARRFAGRGPYSTWLILAAFLANPMLAQNASYTWPKLPAAFFVLLAIAMYVTGWRRHDSTRIAAAFLAFAAALLAHYLALIPAVFTFLHYLLFVLPKQRHGKQTALIGIAAAALLTVTWFGYLWMSFGLKTMAATNQTISLDQRRNVQANLNQLAHNIVDTLFPHPLHIRHGVYDQKGRPGYVRDYVFLIYQTNILIAMGSVGGVIAVVLLANGRKKAAGKLLAFATVLTALIAISYAPPVRNLVWDLLPNLPAFALGLSLIALLLVEIGWGIAAAGWQLDTARRYWLALSAFCLTAGMASLDVEFEFGTVHLILHWLVLAGITWVAASAWRLPRWALGALALGWLADFALGIWLHFHLEEINFEKLPAAAGMDRLALSEGITPQAAENWLVKQREGLTFFADHFARWHGLIECLVILLFVAVLARALIEIRQFTARFHGNDLK